MGSGGERYSCGGMLEGWPLRLRSLKGCCDARPKAVPTQMSIKLKIVTVTLLLLGVLLAGNHLVLESAIIPSFEALEVAESRRSDSCKTWHWGW